MLSESKKSDKFLINVVPTLHATDSTQDFNSQFSACPEEYIQKYRLKCVIPGGSGNGLLAATAGGVNGSTGSISSPVAPSLQSTFIAGAADSMASVNSEKSAVQRSPSVQSSSVTGGSSSVVTLQRELKEAQAEIVRLRAVSIKNKSKRY